MKSALPASNGSGFAACSDRRCDFALAATVARSSRCQDPLLSVFNVGSASQAFRPFLALDGSKMYLSVAAEEPSRTVRGNRDDGAGDR